MVMMVMMVVMMAMVMNQSPTIIIAMISTICAIIRRALQLAIIIRQTIILIGTHDDSIRIQAVTPVRHDRIGSFTHHHPRLAMIIISRRILDQLAIIRIAIIIAIATIIMAMVMIILRADDQIRASITTDCRGAGIGAAHDHGGAQHAAGRSPGMMITKSIDHVLMELVAAAAAADLITS
jgi:hypothetical protein